MDRLGLGFNFQEVSTKLQSWAAEFLGAKPKLYEAKNRIERLLSSARSSGYVQSGERRYTVAELESMYQDNSSLLRENVDLERKFLSAMEELKTIKNAWEESGEFYVGFGGGTLAKGLDAVPVAAIAWATGAAILIGTIAYFISRVRKHLDNLAGPVAEGLGIIGILAILGGAYFLFGRK